MWWNRRVDSECIFKRLDIIVMNHSFHGIARHVEIEHLARTVSDHAPMLLFCGRKSMHFTKLLNF